LSGKQANGEQVVITPRTQCPAPSQSDGCVIMSELGSQEASAHWTAPYSRQPPLPSQKPSLPQLDGGSTAQLG
jgi:hypothetical protein